MCCSCSFVAINGRSLRPAASEPGRTRCHELLLSAVASCLSLAQYAATPMPTPLQTKVHDISIAVEHQQHQQQLAALVGKGLDGICRNALPLGVARATLVVVWTHHMWSLSCSCGLCFSRAGPSAPMLSGSSDDECRSANRMSKS